MKLAWLSKLPPSGVVPRGDGASTLIQEFSPAASGSAFVSPGLQAKPQKEVPVDPPKLGLWDKCVSTVKDWLAIGGSDKPSLVQPFILPEHKQQREHIETYAESPFETTLFSLKKKTGDYSVSRAWAKALSSKDTVTRESALRLFKDMLVYNGVDTGYQLSSHTQMKFMLFTPHLSEGPLGKALVMESLLSLPVATLVEMAGPFKKEFAQLPPVAQALILKQMLKNRRELDKETLAEDDVTQLNKLLKSLVVQFYSAKHDAMAEVLHQQEKIRLGFLKIQPIEDAYRQQLEEIERKYRLKLRQLKKQRSQKVAQAEEEKLRRIEMIYDAVEGSLYSGLVDLDLNITELQGV